MQNNEKRNLFYLLKNFSKNKYYFVDENSNIGLRKNGVILWYNYDNDCGDYGGYVLIGETNTPQGAEKREIALV